MTDGKYRTRRANGGGCFKTHNGEREVVNFPPAAERVRLDSFCRLMYEKGESYELYAATPRTAIERGTVSGISGKMAGGNVGR